MIQTDQTAIVLRAVNYRDNDRMLTLFSPTRGKLEVIARGCRRPRSPLLSASEIFALGDYELYEKSGRFTVTGASLIETFYPLRNDFDRLSVGTYLLNICEIALQPGQGAQELFMLLLHTLSRLTFTDQPWPPLLTGFLLHFSVSEGWRPRLRHCVRCGQRIEDGQAAWMDLREGGLCCVSDRSPELMAVSQKQLRWLRYALTVGSSGWVEDEDMTAPLALMRRYVESRLGQPVRSAAMLPGIQ